MIHIKKLKKLLPFIFILIIWQISSQFVQPLFLPPPKKVFETFIILLKNGMLVNSFIMSFYRITFATLASLIISIPLALLILQFKILDTLIIPITNIMRYLPVTAFYPLLILWVGINEGLKFTFLFIVTFVYFLPSIILCIKDVDNGIIEGGLALGMNKWQCIIHIIFPYCLPSIAENTLLMYGIGWTYVTVAEMVSTTSGLGYLVNIGSAKGHTDMVFVAIFVITIMSFIVDNIAKYLIRNIFQWKYLNEN